MVLSKYEPANLLVDALAVFALGHHAVVHRDGEGVVLHHHPLDVAQDLLHLGGGVSGGDN